MRTGVTAAVHFRIRHRLCLAVSKVSPPTCQAWAEPVEKLLKDAVSVSVPFYPAFAAAMWAWSFEDPALRKRFGEASKRQGHTGKAKA